MSKLNVVTLLNIATLCKVYDEVQLLKNVIMILQYMQKIDYLSRLIKLIVLKKNHKVECFLSLKQGRIQCIKLISYIVEYCSWDDN